MIDAQRQKCHEAAEAKANLWFLMASPPLEEPILSARRVGVWRSRCFLMRVLDSRLRGNDTEVGFNRVFASGTRAAVEVKAGFAEEDSER